MVESENAYFAARRNGLRAYNHMVALGRPGHLPYLDDLLMDAEIVSRYHFAREPYVLFELFSREEKPFVLCWFFNMSFFDLHKAEPARSVAKTAAPDPDPRGFQQLPDRRSPRKRYLARVCISYDG